MFNLLLEKCDIALGDYCNIFLAAKYQKNLNVRTICLWENLNERCPWLTFKR